MVYQGGMAPRTDVGYNVYTASNEPPDWCVELHSEMTYLNTIPDVVTIEILSQFVIWFVYSWKLSGYFDRF